MFMMNLNMERVYKKDYSMFDLAAFSNAFGVVFLCFCIGVVFRVALNTLRLGRRIPK